jgi:diguanylate cyclase (GGDEF)-like protein/PAS domain S-box-containing protein
MSQPAPAAPAPRRGSFRERHLFDYSAPARRYWFGLAGLGMLCLALAATGLAQVPPSSLWQVLGWLLLVAVAAAFPIPIPNSKLSITAGDTVIFLLLALYGAPVAVLAAALDGFIGSWRTSTRLTSRVGTMAAAAIGMSAAGLVFGSSQWLLVASGLPAAAAHLAALALAALPHFVLTTAAMMKVLHAKRGLPLSPRQWFAGSSWVGALYLVSAEIAAMLSLNAQRFGEATVAVGVLVIGLSLALLRSHFRLQIAEHEAQEARVGAAEHEARQNQRRFQAAFSRASIGMAIVDAQGQVQQANQALHKLLGQPDGSLAGRAFQALLHPGDAALLAHHAGAVLSRTQDLLSIELRCVHVQQHEIWVALHCALFEVEGAAAGESGLIYQLHDITSRREAEGELRHIAFHDLLTNLANRNCFQHKLSLAVERSLTDRRYRFAVMVLDLDRFKLVNDSLGHPAGDELLKEVASRLRATMRPQDVVARLGGDEFAILVEDSPLPADVQALGERLLLALARPVDIQGTALRPQASIGITFSDLGYRESSEVLRDADLAMYEAKTSGKGRLALFDSSLLEQLGHKLQLEADLRQAIGEGQLSLAYQPLYELKPYRLNGFESLARWVHPVRGPVSPAVFIALAEESGFIEALTAWAIDEAVRQHVAWITEMPEHAGLMMHVNVSGRDLALPGFVARVREVLQCRGLPPQRLVLEITESTLMEHREAALAALHELCALGVKVGIDDFGTGYSSLAYLSTLPFDCLKIDRSFVIGMDKSPQNLEIVRTVISLGRTLNKQVVAEGIETVAQLRQLRALGATIGQGYLLSRPLPPERARALLAEPLLLPA